MNEIQFGSFQSFWPSLSCCCLALVSAEPSSCAHSKTVGGSVHRHAQQKEEVVSRTRKCAFFATFRNGDTEKLDVFELNP